MFGLFDLPEGKPLRFSSLAILGKIGGSVLRAEFGGWECAAKQMPAPPNNIDVIMRLKHRNIVQTFGFVADPRSATVYVLSELCTYGDLGTFIADLRSTCTSVSERFLLHCGAEICSGCAYLHDVCKMAHQDLRVGNVLLAADPTKVDSCEVVLKLTNSAWPSSEPAQTLDGNVWAVGAILWELATSAPLPCSKGLPCPSATGFPQDMPVRAYQAISTCWSYTFEQLTCAELEAKLRQGSAAATGQIECYAVEVDPSTEHVDTTMTGSLQKASARNKLAFDSPTRLDSDGLGVNSYRSSDRENSRTPCVLRENPFELSLSSVVHDPTMPLGTYQTPEPVSNSIKADGWLKSRRGLDLDPGPHDQMVNEGPGFVARTAVLRRCPLLGFGFQIVYDADPKLVFISNIIPGSPANDNPHVAVGDSVVAINGCLLVGLSEAAVLDAFDSIHDTAILKLASAMKVRAVVES